MTEQEFVEKIASLLYEKVFSGITPVEVAYAILALIKQAGYVQFTREEARCFLDFRYANYCTSECAGFHDKDKCEAISESKYAKLKARLEVADA